jgi:hypothetical protein
MTHSISAATTPSRPKDTNKPTDDRHSHQLPYELGINVDPRHRLPAAFTELAHPI